MFVSSPIHAVSQWFVEMAVMVPVKMAVEVIVSEVNIRRCFNRFWGMGPIA